MVDSLLVSVKSKIFSRASSNSFQHNIKVILLLPIFDKQEIKIAWIVNCVCAEL